MRPPSQRDAHLPTAPSASTSPHADLRRRRFLLALGAGSAAGAAAVTQAVAAPLAEASAPQADDAKRGYHATDHIRTYYASTRI
jgi:hypothetical protein